MIELDRSQINRKDCSFSRSTHGGLQLYNQGKIGSNKICPRPSPHMFYTPCNPHSRRSQTQNDGTQMVADQVANEAQHPYYAPLCIHYRFCCLHALINERCRF